jgi:hypothetical protein
MYPNVSLMYATGRPGRWGGAVFGPGTKGTAQAR